MAPEISSILGGVEVDMREIWPIHSSFAECLAEHNPTAEALIEENDTVIEEVFLKQK